jgi:hypothetical protein
MVVKPYRFRARQPKPQINNVGNPNAGFETRKVRAFRIFAHFRAFERFHPRLSQLNRNSPGGHNPKNPEPPQTRTRRACDPLANTRPRTQAPCARRRRAAAPPCSRSAATGSRAAHMCKVGAQVCGGAGRHNMRGKGGGKEGGDGGRERKRAMSGLRHHAVAPSLALSIYSHAPPLAFLWRSQSSRTRVRHMRISLSLTPIFLSLTPHSVTLLHQT